MNRTDTELAKTLHVSPQAVRYHLDQLGLIDKPARCIWPPTNFRHRESALSGGRT